MTRLLPLTALLSLALVACTDPGTKPPNGADTQAPKLTLTLPDQVASRASFPIKADATDNVGVTRVEFLDGSGQLLGTDATVPFEWVTTAPANTGGTAITASYTVKAYDAAGNVSSQSGRVQVTGESAPPSGDTTRPTVTLNARPNPVASGGQVTLQADASDNIGVTRVEFLDAAGKLLGTDAVAPYELVTTVPMNTGSAAITTSYTVKAYDAAGNVGSARADVQVTGTTAPGGDTTPPAVTVQLMASGSLVTSGEPVEVVANVQDSGGVRRTEVYVNGELRNWDGGGTGTARFTGVRLPANGTASSLTAAVTVKSYDYAGNVGSATATIQVAGLFIPSVGAAVRSGNGTLEGTVRVSPNAQEVEVMRLVNEVRTKGTLNGQDAISGTCAAGTFRAGELLPLSYNGTLAHAAIQHSTYISQVQYEAHSETVTSSPYFYGATVGDRVARSLKLFGGPERGASENVVIGYATPLEAMRAWMNSTGHCNNIMNPAATVLGVGYRENPQTSGWNRWAWTQLFGS
ncbi:Ig-like domain-containing protein [Deinococcus aluminii]|uniref:SCP domain-containing protein n=1 Tax=Deinococcus aluminii TaxID=1656885 RepID=A0ABP9XH99_9DEIO